jgi:pimeloyl-ACP methyl ester carboxylesterase
MSTRDAVTSRHGRVTTRFGELVADSSGSPDERPPLVLLHGLTFNRMTWRPVLDELDAIDPHRRIVAFDLPGHGDSPALANHDAETVVAAVHRAVEAANLDAPVIVGHSIGALYAALYAALHPTTAVVSVDQSLRVGPFAALLKSLDETLHGPDFEQIWSVFAESMHAELLPRPAEALVHATSHPDQQRFLEYQRELLELPIAEIEGRTHMLFAVLRAAGRPYSVIAGDGLGDDEQAWLLERLPQAAITVWPGSGHFPQLAHPRRFAEHLAAIPARPSTAHAPA